MSKQTTDSAAVLNLLTRYPDSVRHPLVAESADWDNIITPALVASRGMVPVRPDPAKATLQLHLEHVLRVLIENVYVMGYHKGRLEGAAQKVSFVVAPED